MQHQSNLFSFQTHHARIIGTDRAAMLLQLLEFQQAADTLEHHMHGGRAWIVMSQDAWRASFPWMGLQTIRKHLGLLVKTGFLKQRRTTDFPSTTAYCVNHAKVAALDTVVAGRFAEDEAETVGGEA